jgi:hydroxyacylglutathione hydrolase
MLKIQAFEFNAFQENTYLLFDETRECVIVDPGCYEPEENKALETFIADQELSVKLLINTHCHIDHVLGNYFVKSRYGVNLLIHSLEEPVLRAVKAYAPAYGFFKYQEVNHGGFLAEGDLIKFGNQTLDVIFVPGHSPGHVAFWHKESNNLIGGDVLFYNSVGRTDLPGGNFDVLIKSIHEKLFILPDETTVWPGHGPETTIGFEKQTNPFCAIIRTPQK